MVFKAYKDASDAYTKSSKFPNEKLTFEDDYGLKLAIDMADVASVTFSEYANDMDKNMDLQIIQHKAQLKAQAKAKQDMTLHMLEKQAAPLIQSN